MKILFLLFLFLTTFFSSDFKTEQIRNERVKSAYIEKEEALNSRLKVIGVNMASMEVYLQVFKYEKLVAIWVKNKTDKSYKLLSEMPFCAGSGRLGPKNKQGDKQIPEGFYTINRFHPESKFHLSLGIDYPNAADKIRSKAEDLGGDIFIHGKCMSAGCVAITDEGIKELYLLTVEALQNGQKQIPVHIFPAKLTSENMDELKFLYRENPGILSFWNQLKVGFDHFETKKVPPIITVAKNGTYQFN